MITTFFLTHLSQIASADETNTGPKTQIKPDDIKPECGSTQENLSQCALFTDFVYPDEKTKLDKTGSVSWSFGYKKYEALAAEPDDNKSEFPASFTVPVSMTIPYDPVFLVEMSIIANDIPDGVVFATQTTTAEGRGVRATTTINLNGARWTQGGTVGNFASHTAGASAPKYFLGCPVRGTGTTEAKGAVSWLDASTVDEGMLDVANFAEWEPRFMKFTTMFLSNAQVKQGYFEFKGVSEFPCAVCIPNLNAAEEPAASLNYFFELWLAGGEGMPEVKDKPNGPYSAVAPIGNAGVTGCNNESHSHVYGSNTPGIFKLRTITSTALLVNSPYSGALASDEQPQTVANVLMTMNIDYLHIKSIKTDTAPKAIVTLETLSNATAFLSKAHQMPKVNGTPVKNAFKEASFFVVAVQAGLYNLGGFFNASADSLKEGIRFGFTDITTEDDSTDFQNGGFIHYQYTLLPPNDLIAETLPETSAGLTLDVEAACKTAEGVPSSVSGASTVVDLIGNNDKLTYKLIKQGETELEPTANNYGFQSMNEQAFNACGEIGGASMYVFADAPNLAVIPDTTVSMPWNRGQAIDYEPTHSESDIMVGLANFKINVDSSESSSRLINLKGDALVMPDFYPKVMLSYAMSYLQMNAVDGNVVGAVPFVSTDAPGPAWTKKWKFQDATGVSGFSEATLIDADFDSTPSVYYHIGGGNMLMIIIIGIVVTAIALAGVGYYFYTNRKDGAQTANAGSVADDTDEA